jgi:acetyl esterase/lipase
MIEMIRSQSDGSVPTIEGLRAQAQASGGMSPLVPDTSVTRAAAGPVPVEWVAAPGASQDRTLVHFHGGGYAVGGLDSSRAFASQLSLAARARVLVVDYRLAPEHPYPAALDDAVAAYRWALDSGADPTQLTVIGESSGGGLALATLVALRDGGGPLPALTVVCSPWTDLTLSGDSMTTRKEIDPLIQGELLAELAKAYLGAVDPRLPTVSPLFADLSGLPDLMIQVGTAEILLDDSLRIADAARAAGVDVTLDVWDDMIHTWQLFAAFVPEGKEAIDKIGSYIDGRLP